MLAGQNTGDRAALSRDSRARRGLEAADEVANGPETAVRGTHRLGRRKLNYVRCGMLRRNVRPSTIKRGDGGEGESVTIREIKQQVGQIEKALWKQPEQERRQTATSVHAKSPGKNGQLLLEKKGQGAGREQSEMGGKKKKKICRRRNRLRINSSQQHKLSL